MDEEQAKTCPEALMTVNPEGYRDDASLQNFRSNGHDTSKAQRIRIQDEAFLSLNYLFERNHTSFYNYLVNEKPLFRKQNKFLETDDDLAALADCKESSWLDLALGKILHWCVPRNSFFTAPTLQAQTDDDSIHLRSEDRVDILIRTTFTIIILALLVAPASVLFFVKGHSGMKVALISVFTLFFAGILHIGTKAQRINSHLNDVMLFNITVNMTASVASH
ncbi:hypothetical protein OEA41_003868 [Lepraria neglecta]|uniref:DUF6594 domain-containing protein n=1 Tax=Lepraria neglecta TaxID=209136 RepID=A0AAD9Z5C4_9LECA|nr:hypothetical protein OEA41_003868 [Lepraria neglecta]